MRGAKSKSKQVLSENLFPVVGVGASAGGMKAFQELIKAIPANSGIAYILIQHLAPEHESILTDILQKSTGLPVIEITDHIKVMPDHIYVIPPNKMLTANNGILELNNQVKHEKLATIDLFFTSLAEVHQQHSIGVIFSGTGTDGTVGLKTIKDQGGLTIVQDKASAAYYSMPQSAIDAEVVDYVLAPGKIPEKLMELVRNASIAPSHFKVAEEIREEELFRQILKILKAYSGADFTYYKQTTIRRRILRRTVLNKLESLKDYLDYLRENAAEKEALFKDVLIPVTAFFRDIKTFEALSKTVFPVLFKNKKATDTVRIWIAGCSTGEEAYSMAICLLEYFRDKATPFQIQIFATDILESSIAKARRGVYQRKDIAGVSEARVDQYFTKINGSYQLNKAVREMVVFAVQNFLSDPPFVRIDLVSCRNVLIYMEPYLQKKALATFHHSLNKTGFLLLGKSETPGLDSKDFIPFSKLEKLYTRNAAAGRYMHVAVEKNDSLFKQQVAELASKSAVKDDVQKAADDAILATYATVGVVVNEHLDIIQFRGATGAYLEAPPGKVSQNILKMAREGLAFEIRSALHKAKAGNERVSKSGIYLEKGKRKVNITVIPLRNIMDSCFLVLFEDAVAITESPTNDANKYPGKDSEEKLSVQQLLIEQLEKELAQVREDMHTISDSQEAVNDELQSANEELLSGSEELQSLNEELETSKEEIQSTNEELTILNQELIERNEQLILARKYAEAIVSTIHEPLVILTQDFRLKSANKSFYKKFKLTEREAESSQFFELNAGIWNIPELRELLQKVLPENSRFENFEVPVNFPHEFQNTMNLNARQLINDSSNEQLILLAFQDITDQKQFEQTLELQVEERTSELKEANTALLQSNENLRQFASIASHDLQEPLRKIKTYSSLLQQRFAEYIPEEGKVVIHKVRTAADRMSQLIKEVLEYSRIAHSNKEFRTTDLDAVLQSVLIDLDLLLHETGAIIDYPVPLPNIKAIPLQVHQLFYNLLTNALKFRVAGIKPMISISCRMLTEKEIPAFESLRPRNHYIEIIISDNGIGFEQQFAEQIFQIFERLHSVDEFEGTGIGLALCKKIAENHHGYIYALSRENEGASIHSIFPSDL